MLGITGTPEGLLLFSWQKRYETWHLFRKLSSMKARGLIKTTAGQNSIYVNKKYQHHSAQAQFTQTFMLPQICNVFIYIFPLPRYFKLKIIAYYIWKQLKCKLSSWWKKERKSFNSSKINVAQTSCNIEEWFSDV